MIEAVALWDWRRQVADLYGAIRREPDPRAASELWRATRRRLFATHPQSAIDETERASYQGPHCFPYDPAFRLPADLAPVDDVTPRCVRAGDDGDMALRPFARTMGLRDHLGGELTLYWIAGYGGGVLLPFADGTSGRETYGGGRYLLDTIKGADLGAASDGRVMLDFNFAYFPSCAYSSRFVCPLPSVENRLPVSVRAGERL